MMASSTFAGHMDGLNLRTNTAIQGDDMASTTGQRPYPRSHSVGENVPASPLPGRKTLGEMDAEDVKQKLTDWKHWSINTYKCTKQAVYEHLGKTERTVDADLEAKITQLRNMQRTYAQLLTVARGYTSYVREAAKMQSQMAIAMDELAANDADIAADFTRNAKTQRSLVNCAQLLLAAMDTFNDAVRVLTDKVIEDTILTIRTFDHSRLEYDAHKNELVRMQQASSGHYGPDIQRAEERVNECKQRYDRLRDDVQVKIDFLAENRVKVMNKQLSLLHTAMCAYYGGNQQAMKTALDQFNIKPIAELNGHDTLSQSNSSGAVPKRFTSFLEK